MAFRLNILSTAIALFLTGFGEKVDTTTARAVGESAPSSAVKHQKCPPTGIQKFRSMLKNGSITIVEVSGVVNYCNCSREIGGQWTAQNGTACLVTVEGYDGEPTSKAGKCQGGVCVYTAPPFGCGNMKRNPKVEEIPIGCAHICDFGNGTRKYDYYSPNVPCLHIYNSTHNVTTTCKKIGEQVLCREDTPQC